MKTFTVEWLPVEGGICPGDHFCHEVNSHIEVEYYNPEGGSYIPSIEKGDCKLLKFLVCSDLEAGNLVVDIYRPLQYGTVSEANVNAISDSEIDWHDESVRKTKCSRFSKGLAIKVLGLLSPNSVWLEAGDQVLEEDIAWMEDSGDDQLIPILGKEFEGSKTMYFATRCPSCKTFH
jgi:hypothetical protein